MPEYGRSGRGKSGVNYSDEKEEDDFCNSTNYVKKINEI